MRNRPNLLDRPYGAGWCRGPGAAPQPGEIVEYFGSLTKYHGVYVVEEMLPDDGRGSHCLYHLRALPNPTIRNDDPDTLRFVGRENVSNMLHYSLKELERIKNAPKSANGFD